ncbi:MAG: type II secretion system F family protein [Candidatus Binataceae bacterium]
MTPLAVGLMIFCLVGAGAMAIYVALYGSHRVLQERFQDMAIKLRLMHGADEFNHSDAVPEGLTRTILRWATARMPQPKTDTPAAAKLVTTLVRAGFIRSSAVRTFHAIRMFSTVAGALIGFVIGLVLVGHGSKMMLAAVAGTGVGVYGPTYYLKRRAGQRQKAISRQLSDVLDLLVVCVDAGLGLFEAIKVVGDETEHHGQEIGTELSLLSGEVAAGASLGQALRNLAERTAVEDVKPLAATLIQSEQLGASIGPALRSSSDAMRSKRRLKAEEAAQKSTIKILFPLVLFILPAMLIVIIAPAIIQAMRTLNP